MTTTQFIFSPAYNAVFAGGHGVERPPALAPMRSSPRRDRRAGLPSPKRLRAGRLSRAKPVGYPGAGLPPREAKAAVRESAEKWTSKASKSGGTATTPRRGSSTSGFRSTLIKDLGVRKVLEIGPHLGLVTAMLASAGYEVTTLDVEPRSESIGASGHIQADVCELDPESIRGFDCILCCETLEHIQWEKLDDMLARLAASGAPWLLVSVPYEGFQFGLDLNVNRYVFRRRSFFRKLKFLRRFRVPETGARRPHRWEIGYRGYGLPR